MIPEGYILLARKVRKSALWQSLKATHRLIMIELLLQAQFQDGEVARNGEILFLKRGQIATSYQMLVDDINDKDITVKVVRNAIDKLVKYDFLAKDEAKARAKKGLLLTVVNYDIYQSPENYKGKAEGKATGITRAESGQSEGKAGAINNNVNKENNSKNENKKTNEDEAITLLLENGMINAFGVNKTLRDDLADYYDSEHFKFDDKDEMLKAAIKDAARGNGRTWKFVYNKLNDWRKQEFKNPDDVQAYESNRGSGNYGKTQNNAGSNREVKESLTGGRTGRINRKTSL